MASDLKWSREDAKDKAARSLEMVVILAKESKVAAKRGSCRTAFKHLRVADMSHGAGHLAESLLGVPSGKGIEERNAAEAAFLSNCIAPGKLSGAPKGHSSGSRRKSRK